MRRPAGLIFSLKRLAPDNTRFPVRVGNHYRAIGQEVAGGVEWVWIGTHEE